MVVPLSPETEARLVRLLKTRTDKLAAHALTVYYAARDPRTPILVRAMALLVGAYLLSPIDLIPDVIPVLGYVDDLLVLSLGVALVLRWTPTEVVESARVRAQEAARRPTSYVAATFIVVLWLLVAWWLTWWVLILVHG